MIGHPERRLAPHVGVGGQLGGEIVTDKRMTEAAGLGFGAVQRDRQSVQILANLAGP